MPHKRGGNIKTEEEEEKRSYFSKYDSSKIMWLVYQIIKKFQLMGQAHIFSSYYASTVIFWTYSALWYLLPSSVPVQCQWQSSLTETSSIITVSPPTNPPTHPATWASIFEPLLDYLGSWNFVWKLHSTKQGQIGD